MMIVNIGSDGPLKCQAWSDISPAAERAAEGALLPLKSDSSIAVRLSSGVLVLTTADGAIRHATFVHGEPSTAHRTLLSVVT